MRPAAVSARVIAAPTSSPPSCLAFGPAALPFDFTVAFAGARDGCFGAFSGCKILLRSGAGAEIGEATGMSFALGDSARVDGRTTLARPSVRPKKLAMRWDDEMPASIRNG